MEGVPNQKCFSIFIDNLPEQTYRWWLRRVRNTCGMIVDAFIPFKRHRFSNSKFGFERHLKEEEADEVVRSFNGVRWWGQILVVKRAIILSGKRLIWRKKNTLLPHSLSPIGNQIWRHKQDPEDHSRDVKIIPMIEEAMRTEGVNFIIIKPLGDGVRVVVTDYGEGDKTDFILSTRAYSRLARPNAALDLFAYGVVDIEYRRIPCQYPGYNLMVKVHEHSRFPEYLALVMLYQAGQNDITATEVWQVQSSNKFDELGIAYGAVWDMANPPAGALNFRVQVSGSAGLKWVQLSSVIPSEWKAGAVYDTTIQLT
ncbi:hypothetical protein TEA_000859 [Camellia sinensis var. sinensis]|uniref:RRM domain-containing protein n=1 Tax=Camellia sinensis var. sinensis TaxID=542762 RepID=A0A4S4D317_CAMSN|nr:hypothetical protein TEA_000859 [Camellia sinensis var. sinensis]